MFAIYCCLSYSCHPKNEKKKQTKNSGFYSCFCLFVTNVSAAVAVAVAVAITAATESLPCEFLYQKYKKNHQQ